VLAVAGGLTAHANLGDVRVLSRGDAGQTVSSVNLKTTLDHGSRTPVIVKPGDVVVVLGRGPNAWSAFATVLGLSRDALNAAVLVDYFRTHKTTN